MLKIQVLTENRTWTCSEARERKSSKSCSPYIHTKPLKLLTDLLVDLLRRIALGAAIVSGQSPCQQKPSYRDRASSFSYRICRKPASLLDSLRTQSSSCLWKGHGNSQQAITTRLNCEMWVNLYKCLLGWRDTVQSLDIVHSDITMCRGCKSYLVFPPNKVHQICQVWSVWWPTSTIELITKI